MYCSSCGAEVHDRAVMCVKCGVSVQQDNTDAITRMLLPVGRSSYAITAGYLGLFSVLVLPAPFSLAFGIMGYRDIKQNPKKHGMGRATFGMIMGALGTAALLFFIVAIIKNKMS